MKTMGKWCITLVVLILAGCIESGVHFTIRYTTVDGLKKNAPLMHDDQIIGEVNEIIYTDEGDFEVRVTIEKSHHSLATDSTLFVIADDPKNQDERIIKLITSGEPGTLIQDDQVVQGSTTLAGVTKELQSQIGETLESFASSIDRSLSEWNDETVEPQIDQLEKELNQLLEDAKTLGENAKAQIKNEVLPAIKQHIEQLKQRMEELEQDDDSTDELDRKLDELDHLLET